MFKATTVTMAVLLSAATVALAAAPAVDVNPAQINVQTQDKEAKRSKPRVPGGSGCDSPHDRVEHPECRV
jgi:hypothetical protein